MYKELAKIPIPTAAKFVNTHPDDDPTTVQVFYSVVDIDKNRKRQMSRYVTVSDLSNVSKTDLEDATGTVLQRCSASRRKRAMLRKLSNGDKDTPISRVVEVWEDGSLEVSFDVTDVHGDFYTDDSFGSLDFAPSERALVYIAEQKVVSDDKDPFRKYRFNPDLGENLTGKCNPTIFLLTWSPSRLFRLNIAGPGSDIRYGQVVFDPQNSGVLYATGYELTMDGRMLGISWCLNRPSGIWKLTIPQLSPTERDTDSDAEQKTIDVEIAQKLTSSHLSCRSPRVFYTGGRSLLIWLACPCGGPHMTTSTLHILNITHSELDNESLKKAENPLVNIVSGSINDIRVFPGLYVTNFLISPFAYDCDGQPCLLLTSQWGSRTTILQVSLDDGKIKDLTTPEVKLNKSKSYSWSLLATDGRTKFICSRSAPDVPYEIYLGHFQKSGILWVLLDQPVLRGDLSEVLGRIETKVIPIDGRDQVETIVIKLKNETTSPCVTLIHGGPHSASSIGFTASTTALAIEGYTISMPNYTGSLGYGDAFVQNLIGKCGELDVGDCIASARHLITLGISEEGRGKQLIMGGSHGGFLTAHLIGRFPSFFSAAVIRNPVISAGEMCFTDIPDWYYSEFGMPYPLSSIRAPFEPPTQQPRAAPPRLTTEAFEKLNSSSPIPHVDRVSIPVLLMIGKADRRVCPTNGIGFYHALKARTTKVEMLYFDTEGHALDGVEAARVSFEAALDWFVQAIR